MLNDTIGANRTNCWSIFRGRASCLPTERFFRVRGNRYRLVAHVDYVRSNVTVLFVGTHSDYDEIDASRI